MALSYRDQVWITGRQTQENTVGKLELFLDVLYRGHIHTVCRKVHGLYTKDTKS